MTFFGDLLLIIKSVPALVKFISELSGWLKNTFGDNPEKFLVDSSEVFQKVKNAQTPQEKRAAAAQLVDLVRRL